MVSNYRSKQLTMNNSCVPFLRWPGGKRWLSKHFINCINKINYNKYCEPFLGGGAIYFDLAPKRSILSDINAELIETYKAVKTSHHELIEILKQMPVDKRTYYEVRDKKPTTEIERAVRFLYLNRLSFAGIYRVNKSGTFNVPYGGGRKVDILWKNNMLENASKVLQNATLCTCDFEETINKANNNDLVYCDPTYISATSSGFSRYHENAFEWVDQKRLAKSVFSAANRGATIIVSNVAHTEIAELYEPFKPKIITRHTCISRLTSGRKPVDEYLFVINGKNIVQMPFDA